MKQFFSSIIMFFIFFGLLPTPPLSANSENYFIVTAYYSPLPDQKYYSMGSYEAEVRLNGEGIAGASGRKVFSGMLAAPQGYAFGTKIYLEGLGIGSVEDRGGAIVPAGQRGYTHDRIDVWMGYGDEGLRRALYWGKRKVPGYIVSRNTNPTINYFNIPAPYWASSGFKKQKITPQKNRSQEKAKSIFDTSLESGSDKKLVSELQSHLTALGFLIDDFIEGEYDQPTFEAVYDFQVSVNILDSKESPGAGRYGPKTRAEFKKAYDMYLNEIAEKDSFIAEYETRKEKAKKDAITYIQSIGKPKYLETSPQVRKLQKLLKKLGVLTYTDTAYFGDITKESITKFQKEQNIIKNTRDAGSGQFGPKTRNAMIRELTKLYINEILEDSDIQEKYNLYLK